MLENEPMLEPMIQPTRPLSRRFFARSPVSVARELLGCVLARKLEGHWVGGWIVETEAYLSAEDLASHSSRGRTPSNAAMFGPAGRLYVYPIHSNHCLNLVTEKSGLGSAVLIRALQPEWGLDAMMRARGNEDARKLTSGPGMICQALRADRNCDGLSPTDLDDWCISRGQMVAMEQVRVTPRIGISQASELPLRFFVDGNQFVSGRASDHSRRRCEAFTK